MVNLAQYASTACTACGGAVSTVATPAAKAVAALRWRDVYTTSCGTEHWNIGCGTASQKARSVYNGDLIAIDQRTLPDGRLAAIRVSEVPHMVPALWRVTAGLRPAFGPSALVKTLVHELAHDLDDALALATSLTLQILDVPNGGSA
ncbi:hypothetical protein [Nocardioides campestrisoli]|uniref:hypothetical protein n=1 Tax=Nocardioides campestrisoli TaxID=2736757 RepID=UPI00163D4AE3|nr:hypothetical protein [Nocardioides campestrisoli]